MVLDRSSNSDRMVVLDSSSSSSISDSLVVLDSSSLSSSSNGSMRGLVELEILDEGGTS